MGYDLNLTRAGLAPTKVVLDACRDAGMLIIHTREGHLPDLSDCPPAKLNRGAPSKRIGDPGKYGRILIRGEYGHDIVDELKKQGFEVHKSQIRLPNGPIKTIGDSEIKVALHTDVEADVTVSVYGETA